MPASGLAIALLSGGAATVSAATHYVDSSNATPSAPYTTWATAATNIQDAVDVAAGGGTVRVTNGTYLLDAEIAVPEAVRVEGMNAETVVVAVNSNRCFNLAEEVFLAGFTITNGYAATDGGGVLSADESTTVSNCVFAGNTAGLKGGGMYRGTAHDCGFMANNSLADGGGTFNAFAYNCTYIDNTATGKGGGFCISANAAIPSNCVFIGNTATYGGATYDATTVIDCVFSNNMAISSGGAVYQGTTAHNCIFAGNVASNKSGGAICRVYAYDCFFTNNRAHDNGGAIYDTGASNCTFIGNHAGQSGGAKSWWNGVMQDCVFISNTAGIRGGAVNDGQLYNCIFYGNHSYDRGGAVSEADLYNCVVYNNSANQEGGGITQGTANNSILWANSSAKGNDSYAASLVRCCLGDTVTYGGNMDCITNNPQFADAANGDFHLQAASPCIDAGSNTLAMAFHDFDGVPRPLDSDANGTAIVDIGCYEKLIPDADSDGDTMPDGWEIDNGLDATVDDASANPDADPHDNLAEYIAGTDPTNSGSFFQITNATDTASGFVVEWAPSVSGRWYSILWTNDLAEVFQPLETNIDFPQSGWTDAVFGAEDAGFYQVEVQLK